MIRVISRLNEPYRAFYEFMKANNKISICLLGILYRIAMDLNYIFAVSPKFSYGGLGLDINITKYVLSWIIFLGVFIFIPKSKKSVSSIFLNMQFAIIFAPMTSYCPLDNKSILYLLMVSFAFLIQIFILRNDSSNISLGLSNLHNYTSVFMAFFLPFILIITVLWGGFYGVAAFDFDFLNEIRKHANYPLFLSYLLCWIPDAIIPFYIVYTLYKKKYVLSILLTILDVMFYMVLGLKFIYLSLLVIFVVFLFTKLKQFFASMYLGLALLNIGTELLYFTNRSLGDLFNSLFGIRFLYGPALNKFLYYEVFSSYPKVYFSDGLIGKSFGLTYPYNGGIGQIAYAYMTGGNLYQSNSCTGYFGDSYAQFGFIGLLVMSILMAYIIKLIEMISKGFHISMVAPLIAIEVVLLNDSALLTTLLSNGLAIIIVLMMIYNKPDGKMILRRAYR